MRAAENISDIQIAIAKLSDENKKYVIAVAQALLFTQKGVEGEQKKPQDMACLDRK